METLTTITLHRTVNQKPLLRFDLRNCTDFLKEYEILSKMNVLLCNLLKGCVAYPKEHMKVQISFCARVF